MSNKGPKVLVLGGCGFIGRHLIEYLITNQHVSAIRIVDKTPPQMAWLNQTHRTIFDNPIVEFVSANLINEASCKNAFASPDDCAGWDYVFNCAAETRAGQTDAVYTEGILKLSLNCARECAKHQVKRYIELSSGCMNSSENTPASEDSSIKPWTFMARYKASVEKKLATMSDLKYTTLRLPLVYGKSDRRGLATRIVITALYKCMNETMKLLWNETMKMNTVHVVDVVAAAWHLANDSNAVGQTYNICDDSDSTQGTLSNLLADIFNVKVDYWGVVMSNVTKVKMSDVLDEINDKHVGPWAEACQRDCIENTPLSPYLDKEQLFHKHIHLDNRKLKRTGFALQYPLVKREQIEDIINDYIREQILPLSLGF